MYLANNGSENYGVSKGWCEEGFFGFVKQVQAKGQAHEVGVEVVIPNKKLDDAEDDPEIWITELTNLRLRLEEVKVKITDKYFWLHVLSNLPEV